MPAGRDTRSDVWATASEAIARACILVVDDNRTNVELLDRLLRRAGGERIVGLTDPRLVVEHYLRLEPDLIMLDLHMPHLDGLAVLAALAEVMPPDSYTPVLVLTADSTDEAKQQALSAGAKDFVTKPFEQTEVLLRARNLLETRALHLALQRHNAELEFKLREASERENSAAQAHTERLERIKTVLTDQQVTMVFQPIVELGSMRMIGAEALARFSAEPNRTPDKWFAEAASVGLGIELELLAIETALAQSHLLDPSTYISVNLSPGAASDPRLPAMVGPLGPRVVVELTEHEIVDDYEALAEALGRLRSAGVRIAVDDAGSGYGNLQNILRLRPDIVKLDIELTMNIHNDPARRALAVALVAFAAEIGAQITAEGIETEEELQTLRQLRVTCGQGYYLGRPSPLAAPAPA